jgi:putative phosphoribosyl transferase
MRFLNRSEAGRMLAKKLRDYRARKPVVLALPRGGVPVGYEIAKAFDAPLDVVLVRKLGVPFQPELALGAIVGGEPPEIVVNEDIRAALEMPDSYLAEATATQLKEIERRRRLYLAGRPPLAVDGRTAILVDDGLATGATMLAALRATRRRNPAAVVAAVPVGPPDTIARLKAEADEVICLHVPYMMGGVGQFYRDFAQVDDATVAALLKERAAESIQAEGSHDGHGG